MRDRTAPSPDGAANLVAAIAVAADPAAQALGVVVVMADQVHAARWVSKRSSFRVDAFVSEAAGPIGRVVERTFMVHAVPPQIPGLALPDSPTAPVAVLGTGLGDDLRVLGHLQAAGYCGAVIDGMGGGHVSKEAVSVISAVAAVMPIVVCSRTASGPALRRSYGYAGGEIDLQERGVLSGGALSAPKARLLLSLLLSSGMDGDTVRARFADHALQT